MVRAISHSVCYIVGDVIASGGKPNRPIEVEADGQHWVTRGIESPYRYQDSNLRILHY